MAAFDLVGAPDAAVAGLAVGPWRARPEIAHYAAPATHAASAPHGPHAADAADTAAGTVWRVDLERDVAASLAALAGGEREIALDHAALDDVPDRLERALAEALAREAAASPSRGDHDGDDDDDRDRDRAGSRAALPAIESSLAAALVGDSAVRQADSSPRRDGAPDLVAFSRRSERPGLLEGALQRVGDLVRGRARIETYVEGQLVARSVTTLTGDTGLVIAPGLPVDHAAMHARSVAIAVRTRHAWARILALVVTMIGRLARHGLPPTGVAVVPLVWGFIRDILREVRRRAAAAESPTPGAHAGITPG